MDGDLLRIITADEPAVRDRSLDEACRGRSLAELLSECDRLDAFRRGAENLYERVRALLFLHAIHRFHLPRHAQLAGQSRIGYAGVSDLLQRRFDDAIDRFLADQRAHGPSEATSSALSTAYRELGFQTLADQVRRSVRSVDGNAWMFAVDRPEEHPLRLRAELAREGPSGFPLLRELTPVRMDLTHSGWSDIFFLGMDHPEGAKVLNVSIDLGVRGRDEGPRPPIDTWLRPIAAPCLRLVSVDLEAQAEIEDLDEVFDFARDYLGLLKAAVVASGIVPPSLEGSGQSLEQVLARIVGPGRGLEITSRVRGIPRGSRLAVSTSLLASIIALCMRATGQTRSLTGPLEDQERRLVVARAILGEWLGGSCGGWQDSGGLWPSIKLIEGARTSAADPEHGVSRGRLLPTHRLLGDSEASEPTLRALQESLVLVHGGMAQDVGPILRMVTEKYLLRSEAEWRARLGALDVLDSILDALRRGDVGAIGEATTRNFFGPIRTIIPQATNAYTERLVEAVQTRFGERFWGFLMLGGMAGGGMGFFFDPRVRADAQDALLEIMTRAKRDLANAVPFAMEPVVYDFSINGCGSVGAFFDDSASDASFGLDARPVLETSESGNPRRAAAEAQTDALDGLLLRNGFDRVRHEETRAALRAGRIGLARNRLPAETRIEDARAGDVIDARAEINREHAARGAAALSAGEVGVVTLAGGAGSRWTQGAGVVKALTPFSRLGGEHRSFLEVSLARCGRTAERYTTPIPHVITTSYLTHDAIDAALARLERPGPVAVSRGRRVGLRLVPTERDLRFAWRESSTQVLEERAQRMRESLEEALIRWARAAGEGTDYTDNLPLQCLHPVGHWYEVPSLILNGTLRTVLEERPRLRTLMLHNVDTLGADVDPALLGLHRASGATLTFEVVPRHIEDRGGGLARVDGRVRLVEGLALPREEDEFELSFYNSMTTWIEIDGLLALFGLSRGDLGDEARVEEAVRSLERRLPTYVALKEVKKRWGHGHEDVFPVAQFEKLWSDMTALPEARCAFVVVPRLRGQQLKEPAQLDGWLRDGSAEHVAQLCGWR